MTRTLRLAAAGLAIAATTVAGSALALNPQPLPPGFHVHHSATRYEPPDPCLRAHARRAAACAGQTRKSAGRASTAFADGSVRFRK